MVVDTAQLETGAAIIAASDTAAISVPQRRRARRAGEWKPEPRRVAATGNRESRFVVFIGLEAELRKSVGGFKGPV
jgi:hypothetical protein